MSSVEGSALDDHAAEDPAAEDSAAAESAPDGAGAAGSATKALTVLLYASDRAVREHVRLSLGRKVARDLPDVRVVEVATQPAVLTAMDGGKVDLAILDGEAVPGGMGLCRQLKDEVFQCPPVLVLTGRVDDAWLATWSRADGVLPHPIDPMRLPEVVAGLLRSRLRRGVSPTTV
jgi:DNA-binding response OmpR family regulator